MKWPYFNAKKILISGAGSGLGRELAIQLSQSARELVLVDINQEQLAQTAKLIGEKAKVICADVSNGEFMQKALALHLDCDVVLANAGVGGVNPAQNFSQTIDHRIVSVNYFGTVHTITPFISDMIRRKSGHLVAIASLAGLRGLPAASSYSASKAAQINFMESLRVELWLLGIKVTTLLPGFIATSMTEHDEFQMPFMVPVEVAAKHCLKKISEGSRVNMFPWNLALLARVNRFLPPFLYDLTMRLINKSKPKMPKVF